MKKLLAVLLCAFLAGCADPYLVDNGAFVFETEDGRRLRVTPYGDHIVRLQSVRAGEDFYPDDHYEMVESHDWPREAEVDVSAETYLVRTPGIRVEIDRATLGVTMFQAGSDWALLEEAAPVSWEGNTIGTRFVPKDEERFTGLGHGYFARADSLDLTGTVVERNYGKEPIEQAPLIVPFYMSNLGYGVFLNSTFPNRFALNADDEYGFSIDDHGFGGRMDYFFVIGPYLPTVLDRYTELNGRPRLPMKAMFGLQLSDKGHDHNSDTPSDETWWKDKITEHRDAGLPLDHVVNDNRWRAGGGKRCESRIEWDAERYPDPAAWASWLDENGLVSTIDFNRCIARFSEGWDPDFNLPPIDNIEFADSAPDLTNVDFRRWFWKVFYEKSLDPSLGYPGDALWIDEFDEQGAAPKDIVLSNGRSSAEMRNYWFFLIAKALVEEGWDASGIDQRPFVWVRGMTAGAQRYATLWSGDIKPSNEDMRAQIRSMQLAGMAGFPFWGHDAGGFYDWDEQEGPREEMYIRWGLAFGSFAPIWKPHGMGQSRWPLDRTITAQDSAQYFGELRYELMPYLYSAAHEAADTGRPIARPLMLEHQEIPEAWEYDLQYYWGPDILVAPLANYEKMVRLWLPPGKWYSWEQNRRLDGDQVLKWPGPPWLMPLYVRAGAIIPRRDYAQSTAFINKSTLNLDVYLGSDGRTRLVEDDDRTEAWRDGERRITWIRYDDSDRRLTIDAATGTFDGAPESRQITVTLYGDDGPILLFADQPDVSKRLIIELRD